MQFWDQQFATPGFKYGTHPNVFVVEQSSRLKPASDILIPGDGEGRNGVWLAQQGHRVTAMDGSRIGLDKARSLAKGCDVDLATVQADLASWEPAPDSADAVVLIYVHLPPSIRQTAHRRLAAALRPGGLVILEAFHPLQLQHTSGGPKDAAMLYDLETLRRDFEGLDELMAEEISTVLDEGPGHQGPARVTRWISQRPGQAR